ncbi:InlB B-repeat-containing protein [Cellulomonas denverensis]|uniref:InlB B-repeat-containing protein n=1 Tax=Cellulomonas denverensis TaxID=264297 RepID=A0A7X6KYB0_9CELL|nr:InlB B-repeat-containing protein [Cellulomonas denverensis]NKY24260.1 InlB B-repeat-containing protein [Cellulomonas denverensis]
MAAPAVDYAGLDAIFDAPQSVNGVVQLDADLTQDLSDGDTTDRLDLAAGSTLTLDLNGYDLNTGSVVLGAGSQLTITDTSTGTPGTFTALPIDSNDPVFDQAAGRLAAIDTAEAALIIEGRARVHADSGLNGTPAIGGTGLVDSGTITIRGYADVYADGFTGIGSSWGVPETDTPLSTDPIVIAENATVTAIGDDGAAIGGGVYRDSGDITITDNAVVNASTKPHPGSAVAPDGVGPGIGGGYWGGSNAGTIRIDKNAKVTATGGFGAGIGGGTSYTTDKGGNGGIIEIADNANVTATSLTYGAGIGGGAGGDGGEITISGNPTVVATSVGPAAGIGGGVKGDGGNVQLLGGTITAINGADTTNTSSAVGNGRSVTPFGSLHIADPATLIIPDPAIMRIPADVTVTGDGELRGGTTAGTVINNGAVQLATEDVDWSTLGLQPNNYLVTRHANTGTPDQEVRVFATTLAAGARAVPAEPTKADHTLSGWNLTQDGTGEAVDLALDTPITADVTHFAQWSQNPPAPVEEPEDPTTPTTPVTPTTPAPGVTTITAPTRSGNLATTGSDLALWGAIAGGLVLAGGLTVLVVRRRSQQH